MDGCDENGIKNVAFWAVMCKKHLKKVLKEVCA